MTTRIAFWTSLLLVFVASPIIAQERVIGERRNLTETVLDSNFFDEYMARLEDQYGDFKTWFPRDRLDAASILTFAEYEDGVVFICFSQKADYYRAGGRPYKVIIAGPAVVFPVFPDDGESKFKNNRYVGVVKKADWSKRDRHFWDEGISITFTHKTGRHKKLVHIEQFNITDTLVGEEDLDDDGNDKRMTDRQKLARLMGTYFQGR